MLSPLYPTAPPDRRRYDPALPALARLTCPNCATHTLRMAARRGWWPRTLPLPTVQAVRVLRYHPGSRCTLAWTLDGWPTSICIAKVLAHHVAATAQTLQNLAQAGFIADSDMRGPALRAAIPELGLLLLDHAIGTPINHMAPEEWPGAAHRAAQWLGMFATASLGLPGAYALRDPVVGARRWQARIMCAAPELAGESARLLRIITALQPVWPGRVRLIHGDLGVGHIFCGPAATTVIDWDSARPGDPCEDAGHLLASFVNLGFHRGVANEIIAAALTSFRQAYAELLPAFAPTLPFFTALACLRKANHVVGRAPVRAARLIQTGHAALAMDMAG